AIGLVRSQPRAEMERMMLAHIEATDADLTRLANDRAQQAKDWLERSGKIPGERLFIVAPRLGGGGTAGAGSGTRPAQPAGASPGDSVAAPAAAPAAAPVEAPAAARAAAPPEAPADPSRATPAPLSRVDLSLK